MSFIPILILYEIRVDKGKWNTKIRKRAAVAACALPKAYTTGCAPD